MKNYDVIVIGAGHAGCEAAIAAAKLGCSTLLVTTTLSKVATLPCNPSIGGPGKGHLVREIGALGGVMAKVADQSAIQIKELNTSKGPAVRAYRAQIEQSRYNANMLEELKSTPNLEFYEDEAKEVLAENQTITGIITGDGTTIGAKAVIVCSGTFMSGQIVIGNRVVRDGGRIDERASIGLTGSLNKLGLKHGRLKTGTPPRIHRDSIDYDAMEVAPGTPGPVSFSYPARELMPFESQVPCYGTYTNQDTHKTIMDNLDKTPVFSGMIRERSPRSCPSLDLKVYNFPEKERHPIFIEPLGLDDPKMYVQGASLAFEEDVQEQIIRSIRGLENAQFLAHGYAVVYDFFPPHQLQTSLETKAVSGLYLAGQMNGTTGYEEAAAQGLMAGINAARRVQDLEPIVLGRDQAYIGVLIDDLVTKLHVEPYRIFTSRAEYRLLLRNDNADLRLTGIGYQIGLLDKATFARVTEKQALLNNHLAQLKATRKVINEKTTDAYGFLSRPETDITSVRELFGLTEFGAELDEQVELNAKYSGYFERQRKLAERLQEQESAPIARNMDYDEVKGLRNEAKIRLKEVDPKTLGQASRIQGVTPADLSIIMVYNRKQLAAAR